MAIYYETAYSFLLLVMTCLFAIQSVSAAYNILILSPITTPSHTNILKPLVMALADERGHSVTYWNGLKPPSTFNSTTNNLRVLHSPKLAEINSDHQIGFNDRNSAFRLFFDIPKRMKIYCTAVYQDPVFHQLMNNTMRERYDLIVIEGVFNECSLLLAKALDLPFIYFNCFLPPTWLLDAIGSPLASEYFPHPGLSYTDEINIWQRTFNLSTGHFCCLLSSMVCHVDGRSSRCQCPRNGKPHISPGN